MSRFEAAGLASSRPFALAGTSRVYERALPFRIERIDLDLELHVEKRGLSGEARLAVRRVDPAAERLRLDAVGMDVAEVGWTDAGAPASAERPLAHSYDGEALTLEVAGLTAGTVRVRYRTTPSRGMYFLAPDELVPARPRQVWTQCQDEDARHLFPCHDKPHAKQPMSLRVRVPRGWKALSNGERTSSAADEAAGVFSYELREPQASYLFTLVAGEFAILEEEVDGVPLAHWVPPGREVDGRRTFARTSAMIRRFGELLGVKYPWSRYTQVVVSDFIFGGMENTTATTLYEHALLDERASLDITTDDLVAHELAHQWFGDLVTCRDWSHAWLNEGFATFMENVDHESVHGADGYLHRVRGDLDGYLSEARARYRRPIVCHDYAEPIDLFDRHLYEKGCVVLHVLRRELGDELFWRGVRVYLERHARGVVETRDLQRALEEVSGRSLERAFEQWVYRAGHPELEVTIAWEGGVLSVSTKQKQVPERAAPTPSLDHLPFAFELELEVGLAEGGTRRERRAVTEAAHSFHLPLASRPRFVVVDPELRVLGEVTVEAPADLLRNQLTGAPSARGRTLAAEALAKRAELPTVEALAQTLGNDAEFWGTRAAAAEALGHLRTRDAFAALVPHTAVAHPKVRRAVASALGHFRTAEAAAALRKLALSDASYLVEAEAARSLGATRQSAAFDTLVDILDRPAWGDVIRGGALDGLAALRDERATPHVLARTRYGVPTRGRRAAIAALPKLGEGRRTREALEDLLDDDDPYLRVDVVRALVDLGDARARSALARRLDRELDGRVKRRLREGLRDLGTAHKREQERLRDEVEGLRTRLTELEARLAKVEAAPPNSSPGAGKTPAKPRGKRTPGGPSAG
jgi:aminopeptidase N